MRLDILAITAVKICLIKRAAVDFLTAAFYLLKKHKYCKKTQYKRLTIEHNSIII
jgi:hypothetical protein